MSGGHRAARESRRRVRCRAEAWRRRRGWQAATESWRRQGRGAGCSQLLSGFRMSTAPRREMEKRRDVGRENKRNILHGTERCTSLSISPERHVPNLRVGPCTIHSASKTCMQRKIQRKRTNQTTGASVPGIKRAFSSGHLLLIEGVTHSVPTDHYRDAVFNTDKNHSVVQTGNETVYKSCDYDDSAPEDTVDWSAAAPEFSKDAVTAAVPLLKEGKTYFFSGNYDGEQCESGQRFAIAVAHGQGLPPDLRPPVADAPGPAAGPDSADAAPAFDFSHPKNVSTPSYTDDSDDETSSSTSGSSLTLASLRPGLMIMALAVLFVMQV